MENRSGTSWTVEIEDRALRLFLVEGLSGAEVAQALGGGMTRAAVLAKIRRLGYRKRQTAPRQLSGVLRAATQPSGCARRDPLVRRLPPQIAQPLPPLREPGPTGTPKRLVDLLEGACRWPIDDPGEGDMHATLFCAGEAGGDNYCPVHRALAHDRAGELAVPT